MTLADAWVQANRVAHQALVKALTGHGGGGAVTVEGDTVSLNLAPFIQTVKQRLVASGFGLATRIPQVNASFVLFQSDDLPGRRPGRGATPRRRRGPVRHHRGLPAPGAAHDPGPSLIIDAEAFLTGQSTTAVRTRQGLTHGLGRLRGGAEHAGLRTGPVGTWVHTNKQLLRIAAVTLAALALVFWDQPTGKTILVLAGLLLVALALIESLNQPPHPPSSPPQPRPEPDSGGASTPKRMRPPLPCWLNG